MVNDNRDTDLSRFDSLYQVIHEVIADGNSKQIASRLGKKIFCILHWGEDPDVHLKPIPSKMIVPFCHAAADNRPIQWLNEQVGGVFVEIPEAPKSVPATAKAMASVAGEFSDVAYQFSVSIKDGVISDKERDRMAHELDELIIQAVKFRRGLHDK